jgi:monoamine oxidase
VAIAHSAAPEELSAAHGLDEPAPVANVAVTGGFAGLVQHLLRDQDIDVLREATVTRIAYGNGRVGLRLGSGESLSVDRVVVTVPLGVLQEGAIAFDPALAAPTASGCASASRSGRRPPPSGRPTTPAAATRAGTT